jgi:hypothetical protein
VDRLADVFIYAPLGLALEARRLLPDLADRGRRQVKFTRVVGKYAVRRGEERVTQVWTDVSGTVEGVLGLMGLRNTDSSASETPAGTSPVIRPDEPPSTNGHDRAAPSVRADSSALAIPDYDSLSAFQVVPRLEGLGGDELEAVREYEESTRGRRTILNRIAQLQAG